MTIDIRKGLRVALLGAIALLALMTAAGCGDEKEKDAGATSANPAPPTVLNAWTRVTAPGATTGAVYMDLVSEADEELLGATVDEKVAEKVELHEVTSASGDDTMGMKQVKLIDLPADKTVSLKPGGFHIMLIGLKKQIKKGDVISVRLRFRKFGEITVDVAAKKAPGGAM